MSTTSSRGARGTMGGGREGREGERILPRRGARVVALSFLKMSHRCGIRIEKRRDSRVYIRIYAAIITLMVGTREREREKEREREDEGGKPSRERRGENGRHVGWGCM